MGGGYLGRRLVQAFVTIVMIVALNFVLFRLMPGSPERAALRIPGVSQEVFEQTRVRLGLDKPIFPDQLVAYAAATVRGDLGYSYKYRGQSVAEVIGERVWPTLILFGLGEAIAIVVGLSLGAYTGWKRGGPIDHIGNGVSLILYSMPYFLLGMILLVIFGVALGWFPVSGMFTLGATYDSWTAQLADFARHLVLPLATVALGLIGQYSILMRSSVVETLGEDYVTTARAKGIDERRVLRSHAIPNALLPTVSLIAINLGYLIAGAITVEVVFNWPGLGTLTVDALTARDYPVLQGIFLFLSITVVIANLSADVVYGMLDPRVKA
ncbi:MAG TPA: ABC transporter permease [Candidatus Saccharimonadales bacterium]|nr:ABC transporter permease [Candidatus Saccharimonadales bacterium]